MSSRSIKKRRHREDFQGYVHQRTIDRIAGGPMWKRAGFPTQEAFDKYLESKPKDGPEFGSQPHVHGPNCNHENNYDAVEHETSLLPLWEDGCLPQDEADKMTDEEWLNEKRLTAEERAAVDAADDAESEIF